MFQLFCSKVMAFRMVEIEQQCVFQECKKNNRKDNFAMSQVSKVVTPTSQQALLPRCVSLCLEWKQTVLRERELACMLRIKQRTLHLKISLFTFSKESSTLPQNVFKNVCNKTGSCIASALMSGDVLAMKQLLYKNNLDYRIQLTSSWKRHLMLINLATVA